MATADTCNPEALVTESVGKRAVTVNEKYYDKMKFDLRKAQMFNTECLQKLWSTKNEINKLKQEKKRIFGEIKCSVVPLSSNTSSCDPMSDSKIHKTQSPAILIKRELAEANTRNNQV